MQSELPIFSKDGYAAVLRNALDKGFSFIRFNEMNTTTPGQKYCLMRHDIDISLKCALEMAEIENTYDVKATYFFMLRSPAYNLFSRYAFEVLSRIRELGHEIALHFDAAHPGVKKTEIIRCITQEADTISELTGVTIQTVSFHQPSGEILTGDLLVPGLINTYNKHQLGGWYYTSDSNRVWKEHNALSVFNSDYPKVQLLIHPIWWIYSDIGIDDAWNNALKDNFYIMQKQFLETERAYGYFRMINLENEGGNRK